MEIERAKWYLKDDTFTGFNSDVREAVATVLTYIEKLEKENLQLKETKRA